MADKAGKYWDEGICLVQGCTPVSPGCEHCWERARLKWLGLDPDQVKVCPDRIERLRKGRPKIVAIWSDLFHPEVSDDFIGQALDAAASGPHQVLILTKRAERMAWWMRHTAIPPNVWPGVTIESQEQIGRLRWLKEVNCDRCWVSVEPILGKVVLDEVRDLGWLAWIVVGCETGRQARLSEVTNVYIQVVIAQAIDSGVPVWVKAIMGPRRGEESAYTEAVALAWTLRSRPLAMLGVRQQAGANADLTQT